MNPSTLNTIRETCQVMSSLFTATSLLNQLNNQELTEEDVQNYLDFLDRRGYIEKSGNAYQWLTDDPHGLAG